MNSSAKLQCQRRAGVSTALAGALCMVMTALAQTIRIPDFRQPAPTAYLQPGEPCELCGRIVSIREKQVERRPVVPESLQGAPPGSSSGFSDRNLVGAVIYLPLGRETTERTSVGGVGTPEMRERFRETTYEITIRLDGGGLRFIERSDGTRYGVGDRVRIAGVGDLEILQ